MKYVYDFGDWIEHRIELKRIQEPKLAEEYPRIAGQNKPAYKPCQLCQNQAVWVCITCSNRE